MKRITTSFFAVLLAITMLFCLSISCLAAESAAQEAKIGVEENKKEVDTGSDVNIFEELYLAFVNNADKILSSLAFIASLIVAFAYRKGLIPVIKSALSAIGNKTERLSECSLESIQKTEESLKFLSDKFAFCENSVEAISRSLDILTEKLEGMEGEKKSAEKLSLLMNSQIDMLYEIFMQSSLPQYSKDAIGEKVAALKRELKDGEKANEQEVPAI
jgi:hypothetical protein